jgi:hypothetical protein
MEGLIKDMVQDDPTKRPTMDEVVARFEVISKKLSGWQLRSRISPRDESFTLGLFRAVPHIAQTVTYISRGLPAVPSRQIYSL